MDRRLVRSYSGRLLWLTGIQCEDPAHEALSARLLSLASIIALTSLIALVVEMTTAYYYGEVALFPPLAPPYSPHSLTPHSTPPPHTHP